MSSSSPRARLQVIVTAHGAQAHVTGAGSVIDFDLTEDDALRLVEQAAGAVLHFRSIAHRAQREEEAPPDNTHLIDG